MEKSKKVFLASRNILRANIGLFHQGHKDLYRVVATELRKLLCDRPSSLVERLFPSARLHPTSLYRPGEDLRGLRVQVPGKYEFDGKGNVTVIQIFEKRREPIPLKEWLDQPFLNAQVTVREFIKSIADKEGAHADPEFGQTLALAKSVHLAKDELLGLLTVGVGEYVLFVLDMAAESNQNSFGGR
jgi:hypothetical protein